MEGAKFDWDDKKDRENQFKHGVSFAAAQRSSTAVKRLGSIASGRLMMGS